MIEYELGKKLDKVGGRIEAAEQLKEQKEAAKLGAGAWLLHNPATLLTSSIQYIAKGNVSHQACRRLLRLATHGHLILTAHSNCMRLPSLTMTLRL